MQESIALNSIIQTSEGFYEGIENNGIISWKGIRYAKPPTGQLRWRPPECPKKFAGIRKANKFGNICPQKEYDYTPMYSIPTERQAEDCLFLNIWSKKESLTSKKAVMVWIHGGRLMREGGSSPLYNGQHLAEKDVVFVSINYRLNAFGFFAHPDLEKESPEINIGNYGLMDQLKALKWIKQNISQFHGDPDNITLVGESAGAWAISCLLATSQAEGLFNRIILQSGAYIWKGPVLKKHHSGYLSSFEEGKQFAQLLGVKSIEDLREIPQEQLVDLVFSDKNPLSCEPIIDGELFKDFIPNLLKKNNFSCDILIGTNANEWSTFSVVYPDIFFENFKNTLKSRFPSGHQTWLKIYAPNTTDSFKDAYEKYHSDIVFNYNCIHLANLATRLNCNAFVYYFNQGSINNSYKKYGAYHGVEIPYALQTLDYEKDESGIPEWAIQYAEKVSDYWVNFAKNGTPNAPHLPHWEKWHPDKQLCMVFGDSIKSKTHPLKKRLKQLVEFLRDEPKEEISGLVLKNL